MPRPSELLAGTLLGDARRARELGRWLDSLGDVTTTPSLPLVSIVGGRLAHLITLLRAGSETITQFSADELGLDAARAAAGGGDTILLPSRTITLTAAKTIPAGVALVGIDWSAILDFSGFNGTALTLNPGAVLANCQVRFVSSGSIEIAVDATERGAIVDSIWPQVGGAAATSIKLLIGKNATAVAIELWFATSANAPSNSINQVAWKDLADGSFHAVAALPANLHQIFGFKVAADGSAVYLQGNVEGDNDKRLWHCANPKAGSPTWTLIAQPNEVISAGTIQNNGVGGPLFMYGETLLMRVGLASGAGGAYGEYNGAAWTWWGFATMQFAPLPISYRAWVKSDEAQNHIRSVPSGGIIGNGWNAEGATDPHEQWQNLVNGNHYIARQVSGAMFVFDIDGGGDVVDFGTAVRGVEDVRIRGALRGAAVFSTFDGQLWLAEDGASFSHVNDWTGGGPVEDSYDTGGGDLYWIVAPSDLAYGSTLLKRSTNRGGTFTDETQDYWSALRGDLGTADVVDMGLVYA